MDDLRAPVGDNAAATQLEAIRQLDEFHSVVKEVPKSFHDVNTELPLLETTLQHIRRAINAGLVTDGSVKAILPLIAQCHKQIAKTLRETDDWRKWDKEVVRNLQQDDQVKRTMRIVRNLNEVLTMHYAAASSILQPLTGRCPINERRKLNSNSSIDAKILTIRRWLSAPDPFTNYQEALKLRHADTGLWFLEGEQYKRWKTEAQLPILLYGIPGCGKTILSSAILQNMFQYCEGNHGNVTACFFFDFKDVQKQDPANMLRSLLYQLSHQSIKTPAILDALFSSCESLRRQPSVSVLLEALRLMIQEFLHVYIVLDALDECAQRIGLMGMLETIAGWQLKNLHLLVTSRIERDINSTLQGFIDDQNIISLQSELVDPDIKRYVQQTLSNDKRLRKWDKDASILGIIEATITNGANGMCVYLRMGPESLKLTRILGFGGLLAN
jgi:hypothetical protein